MLDAENQLGKIAPTYDELQGLKHLRKARDWAGPATRESALRSILQAVEVALANIADLAGRAAQNVSTNDIGAAGVKLGWILSFHRLLTKLTGMASEPPLRLPGGIASPPFTTFSSPACSEFIAAVKLLDTALFAHIERKQISLEELLARESLDNDEMRLLHLLRVSAHETAIWNSQLAQFAGLEISETLDSWIRAADLRAMIRDTKLKGDTFYMQFRGLHQIPEILAAEANAQLACATKDILAGRLHPSYNSLATATVLCGGIVASARPLIDCLSTADYHHIRENLGMTSGSHSVALHDALFGERYEQLTHALDGCIDSCSKRLNAGAPKSIQAVFEAQNYDREAADLVLLLHLAGLLNAQIRQWREYHLALPRHNLGSGLTRSLIGTLDAVQAVEKLRDQARQNDSGVAYGLLQPDAPAPVGELALHLRSAESLDARLLAAVGSATRRRFPDVQNRTGAFRACPVSNAAAPMPPKP
jgi:hypothetical protein